MTAPNKTSQKKTTKNKSAVLLTGNVLETHIKVKTNSL